MTIYPYEFINSSFPPEDHSCFVLMPFAESFDDVYEAISKACSAPSVLLLCKRADDYYHAGSIMEDILRGIIASEFVVADLTGRNPNVFYELGIAHSCKVASRVIITSQNLDDVPFDLRHVRCIIYDNDPAGLQKLVHSLERAFLADLQDVYHFEVEEDQVYQFNSRLSGKNRNFYTFILTNLRVGTGAAKFTIVLSRESLDEGDATLKPENHYLDIGKSELIRMTDWEIKLERTDRFQAYFTVQRSTIRT